MKIKKSELKTLIKECLNENNDFDKEIYFVKGDKIVTSISDNFKNIEKACKKHNLLLYKTFGYGRIYVCNVKSSDWEQNNITANNILRLAKSIEEIN